MKKIILILILGILLQFINADIVSLNSGGDDNLFVNPDSYTEGFFTGM